MKIVIVLLAAAMIANVVVPAGVASPRQGASPFDGVFRTDSGSQASADAPTPGKASAQTIGG